MVRVSVADGVAKHDLRLMLAKLLYDLALVLLVVHKKAVLEIRLRPEGDAENGRGVKRFLASDLGCSPRTQLPQGEIQYTCSPAERDLLQKRAAAAELHIVGVDTNGQNVNLHIRVSLTFS